MSNLKILISAIIKLTIATLFFPLFFIYLQLQHTREIKIQKTDVVLNNEEYNLDLHSNFAILPGYKLKEFLFSQFKASQYYKINKLETIKTDTGITLKRPFLTQISLTFIYIFSKLNNPLGR